MPGEARIFEVEWWSPKWPMSSVPFPPDPRPQDQTTFRDLEAALELCVKAPFEDPDKYNDEAFSLGSYAERLWKISGITVANEMLFNRPQPMYQFNLLRTYNLNCITHKLHHLQAQLQSRPTISYETSQELTKLLQDQAIAIRDSDYMSTRLVVIPGRPWYASSFPEIVIPEPHVGRSVILPSKDETSSRLAHTIINILPAYFTTKTVLNQIGGQNCQWKHQNQATLSVRIMASTIIAVSGGALLIVPMLIMSFNTNRTKSLITVSCSVLLFGFFLSAVMRSKSSDIFVATATYAAVLVVFVGASTNGSG